MESTTMSLAKGSMPKWLTMISPRLRCNSTALMLLEPMSRPTIVLLEPKLRPNISRHPHYPTAAVRTARGFFFSVPSPPLLLFSIQRSNNAFLNFQRLPNLNAGILSSDTYLYSVSGLTPRYLDACRMFMTSGESDIAHCPLKTRRSLHNQ